MNILKFYIKVGTLFNWEMNREVLSTSLFFPNPKSIQVKNLLFFLCNILHFNM